MLVIPVLVVEGVGPVTAVQRSGRLFKARWGESLTGQAAIGLPIFLLGLPFIALGAFVASPSVIAGVVIIAIVMAVMIAFIGALGGVFSTALHRFAVDGDSHRGFSADETAMAFRPRRRRWS